MIAIANSNIIGGLPANLSGGDAPYVYIMDEYPTDIQCGFSLQKMKSDYTGDAIRVRRSSDNAEQDIGFLDSNALDVSSLVAFVGAGNDGFVTTAYNQNSTNGFEQTTANAQPQIVDSGSVITDPTNGLPAMKFDGVDDWIIAVNLGGPYYFDVYYVGSTTDTKFIMLSGATDKYSPAVHEGSTSTAVEGNNFRPDALYVNNVLKSPSTRDDLYDEISIGTPTVVNHYNANPNRWWVTVKFGRYWNTGWEYDGLIQEFIVYDPDNSAVDRAGITEILIDKYVP